jgi:anti-sigma B factor antagonist
MTDGDGKNIQILDDGQVTGLKLTLEPVPEVNGCAKIGLEGRIDARNAGVFVKKVAETVESGFTRLVFSCGGLGFLSSAGAGAFAAFLKMTKERGGGMVIAGLQAAVYEKLRLLGLAGFFARENAAEEAIAFFRRGAALEEGLFPKTFPCPACGASLRAAKAGCHRCPECGAVLTVNAEDTTLG